MSGSVSIQLSRNAARRPSTAGPRTLKWVSRHSCSLRASPCHSSAMPTPPVNAVSSSTMSSLRCVRWLSCPTRSFFIGRNHRRCTPRSSMRLIDAGSINRAPYESSSTRTRTPALARSASDSARWVPTLPSQYTKVRKSIVCSASSIASNRAGKISSPLRSTSTLLPSVAGTPRTPSSVRRTWTVGSSSVVMLTEGV